MLDKVSARIALTLMGIIAAWYLRSSQLEIYNLILKERNPFVEASRRFGKTTSIAVFVHEMLSKNAGWICRWCAPDQKQARTIVRPIFNSIQKDIPKNKRARWITTDSHYRYPNGSLLYLVGVNHDKGESARGPAANIIVLDEYGFWNEAEYISKSILFPQLQNQEGQWFIKASTPPPDLGHAYYKEKEVAIRKGRYIKKIIYENEALSEKEMKEIIEETGGVDTPAFQREYLCEEVADPRLLVVPEFTITKNVIPADTPRHDWPTFYTAGDSGADDNTALLFGYYDFLNNQIYIEDEFVDNGRTTREIIAKAKEIEERLWSGTQPKRRAYDAPKQLIFDIFRDHGWAVYPPEKSDKIAAIHALRHEIQNGRIKIKDNCVNLIRQLKVGIWRDEKHTDFQRSNDPELSHLDALAALIYFNRTVDRKHNPVPAYYGYSSATHFLTPKDEESNDQNIQALNKIFKPRGKS